MREILFRGKRKDNDECFCGDLLHLEHCVSIRSKNNAHSVIPETVGQYTGLTDKNGRKIFEGDILKNDWCFIHSASVVRYGKYAQPFNDDIHSKHIGFYVKHTGELKNAYRKDLGYFAKKCEVIGNIYDGGFILD